MTAIETTSHTSKPSTTDKTRVGGNDVVMRVKRRDGTLAPVDLSKIVDAIGGCSRGLSAVDPMRVATRTVGGLYDGATTAELDELSIEVAAALMFEEPQYSQLAARLLARFVAEEVRAQGIESFSDAIVAAHQAGIIDDGVAAFVYENAAALNDAIETDRDGEFQYFGMRTLADRYLQRHPETRAALETPQYFFMRVAVGISDNVEQAKAIYGLFSRLEYLPSSPTLFNSATHRQQLSSCFLVDSPEDSLKSIYKKYEDVAMLSKFAGGIGIAYHRVRSQGSLIAGTNGHSNGIVPFLKTLDASVAAVNQGGKRKGACCVYLESWHADIEDFLELRDNTGDEARRTHNLNLANWISDLFMLRVERDEHWSLFDPKDVPHFPDLFGEDFERAYMQAERDGLAKRRVQARDLYSRMMRSLAQTGNGWMCFKDASNAKCNQTGLPGNNVHLSNLCTEILEVNSSEETAVCNLGSINLSRHADESGIDYTQLRRTVRVAIAQLDRVIDRNLYAIESGKRSNMRWRPVGLGVMGFQDALFKLKLSVDDPRAAEISREVAEAIYFEAVSTSCYLAEKLSPHPAFAETRAAKGKFQFDLWGVEPSKKYDWDSLRARVVEHGLRNSLMIAIAPTATIASIAGCYECIEPQVSNLFKRETLSGEFIQVNRYLVEELKSRGLWTPELRDALKEGEGSIQHLDVDDELKRRFRTAWEVPMKALVDLAAARGPFIDQSQSLNLFIESPTIGKLSSMYFYAWKKGLKTTYYLRSRPATRIAKTTQQSSANRAFTPAETVACSLENPESCEACQ